MSTYALNAAIRSEIGKKAQALRSQRLIPGIVYGNNVKNQPVEVGCSEFEKVYAHAGGSNLVNLCIDNTDAVAVLIHDVQRGVRINEILHVDFYQVDMSKKLNTRIPLKFIGESKAVKGLGGILIKSATHLDVTCLPQDLVSEIVVDISKLDAFDTSIKIGDIDIPAGIEVSANASDIVAIATAPLSEDEIKKSLEGKPEENIEAVKVEERGKKEQKEE